MKISPIICLLSLSVPATVWAAETAPPAPVAPAAPAASAPGAPAPSVPVLGPVPGAPTAGEEDAHAGHNHRAEGHATHADPNESLVSYLWRKSDVAFHDGDYERAIGLHKAIVALTPDDVESYSVAAWLIWSLGRGDEAVAWLRKGIAANPGNWEMLDAAGQNFDLQKRFADAKEVYARAVELIPKDENSQMLRRRFAHATEKSGDLAGAEKVWQGLVRDYPNDAVNKNNLERVEAQIKAKG